MSQVLRRLTPNGDNTQGRNFARLIALPEDLGQVDGVYLSPTGAARLAVRGETERHTGESLHVPHHWPGA